MFPVGISTAMSTCRAYFNIFSSSTCRAVSGSSSRDTRLVWAAVFNRISSACAHPLKTVARPRGVSGKSFCFLYVQCSELMIGTILNAVRGSQSISKTLAGRPSALWLKGNRAV